MPLNDSFVVVNDVYLFNILTTLIPGKNYKLFKFVYLFDVWVNMSLLL